MAFPSIPGPTPHLVEWPPHQQLPTAPPPPPPPPPRPPSPPDIDELIATVYSAPFALFFLFRGNLQYY